MIKNNKDHRAEEEFDLDAELDKLEALFGKKEGEKSELHEVNIDELFDEVMSSDLDKKPLPTIKEIFEAQFPRKSPAVDKQVTDPVEKEEKEQVSSELDFSDQNKEQKQYPKKRLRQIALFSLVLSTFIFTHFMGSTLKQDLNELETVAQETVAIVSEDLKAEESSNSVGGNTPTTVPSDSSNLKEVNQPAALTPSSPVVSSIQEEDSGQTGEQLLMSQRGEDVSEGRDVKLQEAADLLSQASKTNRSYWVGLLETRRQLTELPRKRMEQYFKEESPLGFSEESQFLVSNLEIYKTRLSQYLEDYKEAMNQGIAPQYKKYHQAIASSLQRQIYRLETLQKEFVDLSQEQDQLLEQDYFLLKKRLEKSLAFVPAPYFNR